MLISLTWNQFRELERLINGVRGAQVAGGEGVIKRDSAGSRIRWQTSGVEVILANDGGINGTKKPDTSIRS